VTSWRDVLQVHPAAELFPLMSPDELKALGEDIKANGMTSPSVVTFLEADGEPWLVDGRNRLDALAAMGFEFTTDGPEIIDIVTKDWKDKLAENGEPMLSIRECGETHEGTLYCAIDDPYAYVISANIHRRHLTTAQKGELLAALVKARSELSDRAIAKIAKVDHKTVGAKRKELEATGEIPQLEKRTGADGKTRATPAEKPKTTPAERPEPAVAPQVTRYCSFCGKSQHDLKVLIAGPTVFICDECVELCAVMVRERLARLAPDEVASQIKPLDPLDRIKTLIKEASLEDAARLRDWFMGSGS
jgi:hypothetical protein